MDVAQQNRRYEYLALQQQHAHHLTHIGTDGGLHALKAYCLSLLLEQYEDEQQ